MSGSPAVGIGAAVSVEGAEVRKPLSGPDSSPGLAAGDWFTPELQTLVKADGGDG